MMLQASGVGRGAFGAHLVADAESFTATERLRRQQGPLHVGRRTHLPDAAVHTAGATRVESLSLRVLLTARSPARPQYRRHSCRGTCLRQCGLATWAAVSPIRSLVALCGRHVIRGVPRCRCFLTGSLACWPRTTGRPSESVDLPATDADTLLVQVSPLPLPPESAHVTRAPEVLATVVIFQEHRASCDDKLMPVHSGGWLRPLKPILCRPRGHRIDAVGMHAQTWQATQTVRPGRTLFAAARPDLRFSD